MLQSSNINIQVKTYTKPHALPTHVPRQPPTFKPGNWANFSQTVDRLARKLCPTPRVSSLKFSFTLVAANCNAAVLLHFDYNVKSYLADQNNSTVSYGSEFCPAEELDTLLGHHLDWPALCQNITNRINYPLTKIDDDTRVQHLHQVIEHGNYKSVKGTESKKVL
eukprot:2121069-Ditylum_brightwellii.AAC.1